MSRRMYIQEKLDRFANDNGLEFRFHWDKNIQRWAFRFVNWTMKKGCEINLSDREVACTNPDKLVDWITNQVIREMKYLK